MSRTQIQTSGKQRVQVQERVPSPNDEVEDESDVYVELDSAPEKDESEEELERLVFGDSAGFREGIQNFALVADDEEQDANGRTGLEGLEDADVGQALGGSTEVRMCY